MNSTFILQYVISRLKKNKIKRQNRKEICVYQTISHCGYGFRISQDKLAEEKCN